VYNAKGNRYYPLFPFGFGLSYTTFRYGKIQLNKKEFSKNENINLSVEVTNTGKLDGDEIVQLYLTDLYSRISQSKKQMKAFKRVSIPAGTTKRVSFTLTESDLAFLNEKLQPEVESGEFEVLVGTNCMSGVTERFKVK
jgi:beta-glucosidase